MSAAISILGHRSPATAMDQERPQVQPTLLPEVISQAQAGDRQALDTLVRCYERQVFRTALRLLGDPEEARDAAQDVFLRLCRVLHQFRTDAEFGPWLYRMTVNHCLDLLRRRKHQPSALDELPEPGHDAVAESSIVERQQRERLQQALLALPERERAALVLRELEGLSTKEVAETMQTSEATIRSQVRNALVKLRELLRKEGRP